MLAEIDSRFRKLDSALAELRGIEIDERFLSMVLQHMCIVMSGNVEKCLAAILNEYVRVRANSQIRRVVERRLSGLQNPDCQKIISTLSDFEPSWGHEFETYSDKDGLKDKIDSIAANRNLIAHGRPTGITTSRIMEYNDAHKKAISFIEGLILRAG